MRTTVDLADETYREAKVLAAQRGITLKRLLGEAVEQELRRVKSAGARQRLTRLLVHVDDDPRAGALAERQPRRGGGRRVAVPDLTSIMTAQPDLLLAVFRDPAITAWNRLEARPRAQDFTRSLRAYQDSFQGAGDVILVQPDSDFFRYLKDPTGGN